MGNTQRRKILEFIRFVSAWFLCICMFELGYHLGKNRQ